MVKVKSERIGPSAAVLAGQPLASTSVCAISPLRIRLGRKLDVRAEPAIPAITDIVAQLPDNGRRRDIRHSGAALVGLNL